MAERNRTAIGVHLLGVVAEAELAQHGQRLGGERLVEFDRVEIGDGHAELGQQLLRRRHRADAHHARRHAGRHGAQDAGARRQAVGAGGGFRGDDHGAGAVVQARRVAGRHRAAVAERGGKLGQRLHRGVAARMLVLLDDHLGLALLHADLDDLTLEEAAVLGSLAAALAAIGEGVLVGAADLVLGGDVLGGLAHRVDAVGGLHARIDEAPAQHRVLELHRAVEGALGLAHHVGRAGHALDTAGDHQIGLAQLHGASGVAGRFEARAAQAVHGSAGHLDRQAGQQARHARDVAIVLTGLVHAAIDHVVDRAPVDIGIALHQRLDRMGGEIVDPHGTQAAVVAADGGADCVANEGFGHLGYSRTQQIVAVGLAPATAACQWPCQCPWGRGVMCL